MIAAGKLDREIQIEREVISARDSIGGQTVSWVTEFVTRAQVVPISGSEALKAGAERATRIAKFVIRWLDINEKDRILFDGLTYDIMHFREIGRKEGLEILAQVVR